MSTSIDMGEAIQLLEHTMASCILMAYVTIADKKNCNYAGLQWLSG